mmetsp:Transcript_23895/g.60826  ORF Transcript_23895/g.60826 Transcript_23895/m.60826 type:complete len:181 (+) Transcript_23895:87-629(+)
MAVARSRSQLLAVAALALLALRLGCGGLTFVAGRHMVQPGGHSRVALAARGGSGGGGINKLMEAAHAGDADKLKELIAAGEELNAQDDYGWTPLRFAVRSQRFVAAQTLLDAGADPNLPSKSGRTPLMSAVGNRLEEMVSLLIKGGADPSVKDSKGQTAYDLASRGGPTGSDMIRELVKP